MDTKLDWGSLAPQPLMGKYPALHNGAVLFVERNGRIEFPAADTRVWSLSRIANVGWLNVAPTQFRVNVTGLTSGDGIPCCCVVYFEVELKSEPQARIHAATAKDALYGSFVLISKECALPIFGKHEYPDLLSVKDAIRDEYACAVLSVVESRTPYKLRSCVLDSVAATVDGFDDELRRYSTAEANAEKAKRLIAEQAELEQRRREAQQAAEKGELEHELSLDEQRAAADLRRNHAEREQELALEARKTDQDLDYQRRQQELQLNARKQEAEERLRLTSALPKDINEQHVMGVLALTDPKLAADIIKQRIETGKYVAQANAEMAKAMGELIGASLEDSATAKVASRVFKNLRLGVNSDRIEVEGTADGGEAGDNGAGEESQV